MSVRDAQYWKENMKWRQSNWINHSYIVFNNIKLVFGGKITSFIAGLPAYKSLVHIGLVIAWPIIIPCCIHRFQSYSMDKNLNSQQTLLYIFINICCCEYIGGKQAVLQETTLHYSVWFGLSEYIASCHGDMRTPILCGAVWFMFCLQCCVWYHAMLYRVLTAPDCILF